MFFKDFIKEPNPTMSKEDLKNEAYLTLLKDVKIVGQTQRTKRHSTVDTIQQTSKQEESQNLFNFMLQKHVDVYNWWLNNLKNKKQKDRIQSGQSEQNNCFKKLKCRRKGNTEEQLTPKPIAALFQNQSPNSMSNIQSKCDLSSVQGGGGGGGGGRYRNNSVKQTTLVNESFNVVYYNKKLDKNQYFRVNIVPLFLHEPFLSISFQDVSEFQNIKEQQLREKGLSFINSQALFYMQIKLDSLEQEIQGQASKLFIRLRKKIVFLKEIVNIQTKNDKIKLEFTHFNLSDIVQYLVNLFPNIKRINVDNISIQNDITNSTTTSIDLKTNMPKISQNLKVHRVQNNIRASQSLSCSELQNYDENIPQILKSYALSENDQSVPVFGKDENMKGAKRIQNRTIPSLYNVKTIQELECQSFHNQPLLTGKNSSKLRVNDEAQSYSTIGNSSFLKNNILNANSRRETNLTLINNQSRIQNNSHINFSFEILNTNNNNNNNVNKTQDIIDYSFRGSESPTQLFPQKQNNPKYINNQLGDISTLSKSKGVSHSILMSEEKEITTSKPKKNQSDQKINYKESMFIQQIKQLKLFSIFNDKILLKQVLVGLISVFKGEDITIDICVQENKLYKSIKFCFKLSSNEIITHKKNGLTSFQQSKIDQIFGVQEQEYQLLKKKLLDHINQIILLLSPNKFKFIDNILEVEFYYLRQNLIEQQKNQFI